MADRPTVITDELPDRAIEPEKDKDPRLKQVMERFEMMQLGWSEIHSAGQADDRFVGGDQWEDLVREEREEDGRPIHTYNLLLTYCHNIVNQVRQNWPQLRVKPVEAMRGTPPTVKNVQGTDDYAMADVYMGIIRNIEHQSRAKYAYITACEHQTQHGFGYFRLMPEYPSNDSFHQELRIKRVMNSYSLLIDPTCEEADFSDMMDAFVFSRMSREAFAKKYPDAKATSFEGVLQGTLYQDWFQEEMVRVAEYMWIDYRDDEVLLLSNGVSTYLSDIEPVLDELDEQFAIVPKDRRAVKRPVCMWQKMTAVDILEEPRALPFSFIPIFPVVGKELIVDGKVRYNSAIRDAKDAQRSFNYWKTASTETVALAPRAPWLLTEEQLEGHDAEWDTANRKNLPYLTYNHIEGHALPQRVYPSGIAAAELAQAASEQEVIQNIIGLHEANMGEQGNEKSGKAIIARQNRGDLATFVFPDNLSRAVEHLGRVLVEAIPRVYDSERIVRIRMPDDTEDFVEINTTMIDEDSGEEVRIHDLGFGKFDVVIDTGPSYATQRQEGSDSILALMERLPEDKASNVAHKLVQKMDFPGAEEVYELLRKMLPDQLKTAAEREADLPKGFKLDEKGQVIDEETGKPPEPPPPSPEQQVELSANDAKSKEAQAKVAQAQATQETAKADIAKAQAAQETAKATIAKAQAVMAEAQKPEDDGQQQQALLSEIEKMIMAKLDEHNVEVDEKITEAVVETLKRVKGHLDSQESEESSEGSGEGSQGVVLQMPKVPQVKKLDFTRDASGDLAGVVPSYAGEEGEAKVTGINFERDANGELTRAVPEYDEQT